jgi:hypothetical protein
MWRALPLTRTHPALMLPRKPPRAPGDLAPPASAQASARRPAQSCRLSALCWAALLAVRWVIGAQTRPSRQGEALQALTLPHPPAARQR